MHALFLVSPAVLVTWLALRHAHLQGRVMQCYLASYDEECCAGQHHMNPRIFTQAATRRRVVWAIYAGWMSIYGGLLWWLAS